ncbi:MAG: hypothetical protein CVV22_10245 [Ignavibacteriae bacterium HGW-Ignavibacteriae-1]|jgi:hypothetical protein|nr:MAG: hypothetical protein CVV22_10245 [Ignavibacteriae bacterium HGW-Ignavibacteriae-1]
MNKYIIPLVISILFLAITLLHIVQINEKFGEYVYPLDDTYIHLATADNLANHGVWGVTKHGFTSSSSSPIYPILISGLIILTDWGIYIPLVLNTLFALLLFYMLFRFSEKEMQSHLWGIILVVGIFILSPISANIYNGMEHLLHILVSILFLTSYIIYNKNETHFKYLALLAFALVCVRYESIFIIIAFSLIELYEKRYRKVAIIMAVGVLPIVIYGIISLMNGDMFLPNSILLKGDAPRNISAALKFPMKLVGKFIDAPHLAALISLSIFYLIYLYFAKNRSTLLFKLHILCTLTALMHIAFAKTGWVYRYESYLMAMYCFTFIFSLKILFEQYPKLSNRLAFASIFILFSIPSVMRYAESLQNLPQMSKNIHDQQIQMSKFLHAYYDESSVVLNDIGACCYFTSIRLADMIGLADRDVIQMRIQNNFNKSSIEKLTREREAKIAIIYVQGFQDYIPESWLPVAKLKIRDNIGCAYDEVTFFSSSDEIENVSLLRQNLEKFKKILPNDVFLEIFK